MKFRTNWYINHVCAMKIERDRAVWAFRATRSIAVAGSGARLQMHPELVGDERVIRWGRNFAQMYFGLPWWCRPIFVAIPWVESLWRASKTHLIQDGDFVKEAYLVMPAGGERYGRRVSNFAQASVMTFRRCSSIFVTIHRRFRPWRAICCSVFT